MPSNFWIYKLHLTLLSITERVHNLVCPYWNAVPVFNNKLLHCCSASSSLYSKNCLVNSEWMIVVSIDNIKLSLYNESFYTITLVFCSDLGKICQIPSCTVILSSRNFPVVKWASVRPCPTNGSVWIKVTKEVLEFSEW